MLGSYRSMSYLKPLNVWYRLLSFLFRWQEKTIEEQYNCGVRVFDIGLFCKRNNYKMCFKYDNVIYDAFSFYEPFTFLNMKGDAYVRIILEETKTDIGRNDINKIEDKFKWCCNSFGIMFPDIKFFGGFRKYDGKVLYEFKDDLPDNEYNFLKFV